MARKLRIQYSGAIYRAMSRGDRQEPILKDDQDRLRFLDTLAEACEKTAWQVHAYCLMRNHFLVVEKPQPNLVAGMKWFLGTYNSGSEGCRSDSCRTHHYFPSGSCRMRPARTCTTVSRT
jgi:REP element-mobilizing transposase RayT